MKLIGFEPDDVKITKIDSMSELLHWGSVGKISEILDKDLESPNSYFIIQSEQYGLSLGLATSGGGHFCGIIRLENKSLLFNERNFHLFDSKGHIIHKDFCDGIIYEIFPNSGEFIVIHEIGASRHSTNGLCLWKIHSDLVEDYRFDDRSLVLIHGGKEYVYDKENGIEICFTKAKT